MTGATSRHPDMTWLEWVTMWRKRMDDERVAEAQRARDDAFTQWGRRDQDARDAQAELALLRQQKALLVASVRRMRDEVEHAKDRHGADYMVDKHAYRVLKEIGEDPYICSGAYSERKRDAVKRKRLERERRS